MPIILIFLEPKAPITCGKSYKLCSLSVCNFPQFPFPPSWVHIFSPEHCPVTLHYEFQRRLHDTVRHKLSWSSILRLESIVFRNRILWITLYLVELIPWRSCFWRIPFILSYAVFFFFWPDNMNVSFYRNVRIECVTGLNWKLVLYVIRAVLWF